MKKIFTLILAGVIACSLGACGGNYSETDMSGGENQPETTTQTLEQEEEKVESTEETPTAAPESEEESTSEATE